ncbi:MAG: hypothetical protein V4534_08395 [Myxococcota bacterium]
MRYFMLFALAGFALMAEPDTGLINVAGWDGSFAYKTVHVAEKQNRFEIGLHWKFTDCESFSCRYYVYFDKQDCQVLRDANRQFRSMTCSKELPRQDKRIPFFKGEELQDILNMVEVIQPVSVKSLSFEMDLKQVKFALEQTDSAESLGFAIQFFNADGSGGSFNTNWPALSFPARLVDYITR